MSLLEIGTKLKQYTDKFVYWQQRQQGQGGSEVFALNMVSSMDLERFTSALSFLSSRTVPIEASKSGKEEQQSQFVEVKVIDLMVFGNKDYFINSWPQILTRNRPDNCAASCWSWCKVSALLCKTWTR
jgi:hypothetical protein